MMNEWSSYAKTQQITNGWRSYVAEGLLDDPFLSGLRGGPARTSGASEEEGPSPGSSPQALLQANDLEEFGQLYIKIAPEHGIKNASEAWQQFISGVRDIQEYVQKAYPNHSASYIQHALKKLSQNISRFGMADSQKHPRRVAAALAMETFEKLANWMAQHATPQSPTTGEETKDVEKELGDKPEVSFADPPTNRQQRRAAARGDKGSSKDTARTPEAKAKAAARRKARAQRAKKARQKNRQNEHIEIAEETTELLSESVINQWQKLAGINPRVL